MKKSMKSETQALRARFDEILSLRSEARRAKVDAEKIDADCQRKWSELKEALRAEPETVGSQS